MNKSKLPDQRAPVPVQGKSPSMPAPRRNVPASILGWGLLVGGLASLAVVGVGLWGLLACAVGIGTLVVKRLTRTISPDGHNPSDNDKRLKELKRFIGKTRYLENVGDFGEQAADQFTHISRRFSEFHQLLALKFEPSELTFGRYYGAAEQVYLGVLDNLQLLATTLNNADAINPRDLKKRMSELAGRDEHADEFKALEERSRLHDQEMATVRELLSVNEQAITELDRVRAALAETQTRMDADVELDSAMAQLAQLAERAKQYDINRPGSGTASDD